MKKMCEVGIFFRQKLFSFRSRQNLYRVVSEFDNFS
jgi:hypothetical protein